ncbi:hypothetical protein CHISP_2223 [Chitinispirillum alkaliphilum]|nr:hypothetical protein CHISP_2223 [Chitinispirillum alkaliphilum]
MGRKNKGFTRKNFFIDRNLQGRYMVTFLVPMIILLLFMLVTLYFASQTIISTTARIARRDMQNITAMHMQDRPEPTVEEYRALTNELNEYVRELSTSASIRRELVGSLLFVFGVGLLLVIAQIVLLTIFFSHKLAGPVYRFEKACKTVIEGSYVDMIYLRRGDQMQNLAKLLNEAISVTRERMNILASGEQDKKEELSSKIKI